MFARHFAEKYAAKLILTGRSALDEEKQAKLKALEELGSQVMYIKADVCDASGMKEGLRQAKERFGGIHGVLHMAGIEGKQSILEKELASFTEVIAPKITGTLGA